MNPLIPMIPILKWERLGFENAQDALTKLNLDQILADLKCHTLSRNIYIKLSIEESSYSQRSFQRLNQEPFISYPCLVKPISSEVLMPARNYL